MDSFKTYTDPYSSWWPYIISTIVGIIACIRSYMSGTPCPTSQRVEGKTIVITGASGGIGFEVCKELAKRGGHIIMCCHTLSKGTNAVNLIKKQIPKASVTLKVFDLTVVNSIRDFVDSLKGEKVDILINNAGIVMHPYEITEDNHEIHMATNYLGHFLLTHLMLGNLKKSKQGRIINVSAGSYQSTHLPLTCDVNPKNYTSKEWFAQSKLAIILTTKFMKELLENTNITINAMNPGMVRSTEHLRNSIMMKSWSIYIPTIPWMWLFMKSPKQGAQTIIYLATDPYINTETGKYYNDCSQEETIGHANNIEAAELLYYKTCDLLHITPINK